MAAVTITSTSLTDTLGTTKHITGTVTVQGTNVAQVTDVALVATVGQTLTGPTGATGVVITPASSGTGTLTLKGVAGDTGIPLSATQPTLLTFNNYNVANSIYLVSTANTTVGLSYF